MFMIICGFMYCIILYMEYSNCYNVMNKKRKRKSITQRQAFPSTQVRKVYDIPDGATVFARDLEDGSKEGLL